MRKMIIMRGPQGVGKSALAGALGLGDHVVSSDSLRLALSGPEHNSAGSWSISQDRAQVVWALFNKTSAERMERGETLVLDAMFLPPADVKEYAERARGLGYEVALADFTGFPIERALAQDAGRDRIRRVGERGIASTYKAFANAQLRPEHVEGVRVERWGEQDGDAGLVSRLSRWLRVPETDLSSYERVVHIGDLQGCLDVLAGPGGPLHGGLDPNAFYVFTGDLLDRGLENGQVFDWFRRVALPAHNAVLVAGNHEDHIWRFAKGLEPVSREFASRTLPQLLAMGATPEQAAEVMAKSVDIFPYHWRGSRVVANHAGLTGLPPDGADGVPMWHLLPRHQLTKGAGSYSDPVDQTFHESQESRAPQDRWIQVHGHRNRGTGVLEWARSVNLEDGVEFGGNLRVAELSEAGWTALERPNKIFASWRARFGKSPKPARQGAPAEGAQGEGGMGQEDKGADKLADDAAFAFDVRAPIPAWITEAGSAEPKLSEATLAAMRAHAGVLEKPMPDRPHISSLNFTRDVFFDKLWDDVVVKARGLFFDTGSREVVSRGYEKFFNIGERPETELSALSTSLAFPVVGYLKDNGYLGNLGYDAARDELVCASKSTTGGDFAAWFKEIFEALVPAAKRDEIKRYLRDAEACMVFEVVDPVRDPHMIDYPEAKLTLLDVFHRSEDGRKLPYDELKKAAGVFGLSPKQRMFDFKTMQALTGWMNQAYKDMSYRYGGQDIEGVVFEDAKGFQTKCKLPHYGFWKSMRSSKDRVARAGERMERLRAEVARNPGQAGPRAQEIAKVEENLRKTMESDSHPMAKAFLSWCAGKPHQELAESGIIALRKRFDAEVGIDPAWLAVRWDRFDPTEKEVPKAPKGAAKTAPPPAGDAAASEQRAAMGAEAASSAAPKPKM